jgi:hypothetical protein
MPFSTNPNPHCGSEPLPKIRSIDEVALLCMIKLQMAVNRIYNANNRKLHEDEICRHILAADALLTLSHQ